MAAPAARAKSIGHYVLMKTIGEGTFGKVKLGTHILTGERVAVKVLEKERIIEIADVERVAREIHILKLVRHPHIIQLYEIIETPRQLYLIMEYASGGELFDYIVQHNRAEEKEACRFLHQILAGVEKVHDMRVVHRDLKPENLLLDDRKDIKIADFGLSNTYKEGQLLQTACGSPCYAAPEMIAGHRYNPSMVDVWSCGVILFALVCGYLPFEDENHGELYKKILNAEYEVPEIVSKEVADLISGMLTTDPSRRFTLGDIRQHVWYIQMPEASIPADIRAGTAEVILDEEILEQLESYGFPREYAIKCLQTNKHNHVTTTYYLLKVKRLSASGEGASNTIRAIADLDATGFEELDPPAGAASMAAAVAAVATPSRSGDGRRPPAWLDAEGGLRLPGESSARPSSRERGTAGGASRPIPKLNLNALPRDDLRPSSGRSGSGMASAAAAAAHAAVMAVASTGASGSRSPASRPPAVPGSYSGGYGGTDPHDVQPEWPPSPRSLAFESTGTPRTMLMAPMSARAGSRGGDGGHSSRRRHAEGGPQSSRRPNSARAATGGHGWDDPMGGYGGPARGASPRRSQPPMSARPRLQGNSGGYVRGSSPRGGSRPSSAHGSAGRPVRSGRQHMPLSARGASGHGGGESRAHSSSNAQSNNTLHVPCHSSRHPRHVTQEVLRVLMASRISCRQVSTFLVRAQSHGFRLEAEVLQLDRGGGYVLRLSRVSGDVWVFKDICAQLLAELQI